MLTVVEAVVGKLVEMLIGYLWSHHEAKMQGAVNVRQLKRIAQAQLEATHATQQADEALVHGAAVVRDVAHAGSLRAGSDALNAEIDATS